MLLLKILWHVVAFFAYRFFKPDYARQFFTQWVENSRPKFKAKQKFSVIGSGFLYHDSGAFGEVYISPCRRFVLKKSYGCACDKAYGAYLKFVMANQGNPYVPKVYAFLQEGDKQVVLMERLHKLGESQSYWSNTLSNLVRSQNTETDDADLNIVLEGICQLIKDGHRNDIYGSNIMRRKTPDTPKGYQVVITDPVS